MTYDVITIGDTVQDIFIKPCSSGFCARQINMQGDKLWLRHGDKISVEEIHYSIGGSAANVAVGLRKLALKTAIIGAVGDDLAGERLRASLLDQSVDIHWLKKYPQTSSSTAIIIVFNGERTVLVYRGLRDYSQIKIPHQLATKWIYLGPISQQFSSNYPHLISLASEKNIQIAINPSNRQIEQGREDLLKLLKVVKILILNKRESLDFTHQPAFTDIKKILRILKSYGPEIVVITDGKNGAYSVSEEGCWGIKSYPVRQVVDPTGAGDAFSSGFLAGFIANSEVKESLRWGITNSAMILEKYGAQTNLQTRDQLEKLLKYAPAVYKL